MTNIQKLLVGEPSPCRTTEHGIQESRPVKVEAPPTKRLDGEVGNPGRNQFSGGRYCEVWVGEWEEGGGGKADAEKVRLRFITPTLVLIWFSAGGLESTSNSQVREGAQGRQGSNFTHYKLPPRRLLTYPSLAIRNSLTTSWTLKTPFRSMVCTSSGLSHRKVPMVF